VSMERISKHEIEQKHYSTFKSVFITLMLIIVLVLITAFMLIKQGASPEYALYKSFFAVTHFPEFGFGSFWVSLFSVIGAFLGLYIIVTLLSILYGGGLRYELKEGRKMSKIAKIKDHVIVCGANIVGNNVAVKLDAENIQFVVVDDDLKGLAEPTRHDYLIIEGNPLDEDTLKAARIEHAAVLVAVLEEEGANFLLTSMAKKLNPKLKVVAKTDNQRFVEHMEKNGADMVMMPEVLGAYKIADVVNDILDITK
jgi:voltage-gated potassium channel